MIRLHFLVLALLTEIGLCLKCYNTDTPNGNAIVEECWNEDFDDHICVKLVMPELDDITSTDIRRCEIKGSCTYARQEHCFECQTDLCNAAFSVIPSFSIIVVACLLNVIYFK